jgi:spermidine synthase
VHVRDAFELIAEVSKSGDKKYDLIVCDSTDPVGFASALFEGMQRKNQEIILAVTFFFLLIYVELYLFLLIFSSP